MEIIQLEGSAQGEGKTLELLSCRVFFGWEKGKSGCCWKPELAGERLLIPGVEGISWVKSRGSEVRSHPWDVVSHGHSVPPLV